ncbi:ROK family transcriptional regulator [Phytohabitans rumicis]|uniref:Transcriptional regulator n=1 Tax=Phytohabitans rumicis TaxID=1076125 RepID=A0A6V8L6G9_9ACTN|nr:ROK family transcriptional regulator [Phytohabitans rumicis]GFJ91834.1 transcriptional regulator [Phytohabitans rumicis]
MTDAPVRQGSLREHNLGLVLRQVASAGRPPSRADIAAATSLTRATVSALVDDLIEGGLLTEVDPAPRAGAGRPAAGLVLSAAGPAGLGLEINVDYLSACVVDLAGSVRHQEVRHADQRPRDPAQVWAEVAELAASARARVEQEGLLLAGAAVAVPGLVTADGLVRLAPNLGWRDVAVPSSLAGVAVTVDNEANLAALSELHASASASQHSFLYVSGEIGIGAGIVLNGALFRGARGWSGELGHVAVHPDGPTCRCGAHGCLEQYAGQEAILRAAGAASLDDLRSRAEAGDPAAGEALAAAGTALGVTIAGVINLLDVEAVVLGGAYAPLARWLHPGVAGEIGQRVLTAAWSPVPVRPSLLGGDAAVVGAAGSVVRAIRDHPARWLAASTRHG